MTAYTPVYALPYLAVGQPARDTRAVTQEIAEKIEAALAARGVPPADLPTLIAAGWFSDTGRTLLAPAATWATSGTAEEKLGVRRAGKTVTCAGVVIRATGSTIGTFATLPVQFRPPAIHWLTGTASGRAVCEVQVKPTGELALTGSVTADTGFAISGSWLAA